MNHVSDYILPLISLFIIFYGFFHKVNVYDSFIKGVIEGFKVIIDIAPTVITMIFVIDLFLKSNITYYLFNKISFFKHEIISMMFLRPISGTATLGIMQQIFDKYGPDSSAGYLASLLQGSTETTVYVIALYFGSVNIKKIGNTLKIGLIVDLIGILFAIFFSYLFF